MAADKNSPRRRAASIAADETEPVSEDIARIVQYLDDKRTGASERASGLAHELSHRRDESSQGLKHPARRATSAASSRQHEPVPYDEMKTATAKSLVFSERYHSFCHDLDRVMDRFRERLDGDKPIQH